MRTLGTARKMKAHRQSIFQQGKRFVQVSLYTGFCADHSAGEGMTTGSLLRHSQTANKGKQPRQSTRNLKNKVTLNTRALKPATCDIQLYTTLKLYMTCSHTLHFLHEITAWRNKGPLNVQPKSEAHSKQQRHGHTVITKQHVYKPQHASCLTCV